MRRTSGQRLAGILEWTPIFKRAHKRYKQARRRGGGRSDHPPAHEMEFRAVAKLRERGLRTCLSSGVATPTPTSMPHRPHLRPRFDRYLAASTKFANWKRRLIRWMSIRDFLFYGLVGVYEYTSCACVWKREVWILWIEGLVVIRGRDFFFPSLRWEVYRFEFDRLLGIVEILHVFLRLIGIIIRNSSFDGSFWILLDFVRESFSFK